MRDVLLKSRAAAYYFKYLRWDSQFFCKGSYQLVSVKSKLKPDASIAEKISSIFKNTFISLKIDSSSGKKLISFLQKNGFVYIDTEIVLKYSHPIRKSPKYNKHITLLELKKNAELPYKELGSSFLYSRFHSDVHIPKSKADQVWIDYLKNFQPNNKHHIFIVKYDKKVAGVVLANVSNNEKKVCLFYVTVARRFQGKGVGSCLLEYVVKQYHGYSISTETLAKNTPAINFYIKNGFTVIENTKLIMHRWS